MAKKKFYYNGRLVRTSENREYTHAVLNEFGGCMACSSSYKLALSNITKEVSYSERVIANANALLKALEAGKSDYWIMDGRKRRLTIIHKNDPWFSEANAKERIAYHQERIKTLITKWQVVELEQR